jgi:hypothetical protein
MKNSNQTHLEHDGAALATHYFAKSRRAIYKSIYSIQDLVISDVSVSLRDDYCSPSNSGAAYYYSPEVYPDVMSFYILNLSMNRRRNSQKSLLFFDSHFGPLFLYFLPFQFLGVNGLSLCCGYTGLHLYIQYLDLIVRPFISFHGDISKLLSPVCIRPSKFLSMGLSRSHSILFLSGLL